MTQEIDDAKKLKKKQAAERAQDRKWLEKERADEKEDAGRS
jgi:hypothetical protein